VRALFLQLRVYATGYSTLLPALSSRFDFFFVDFSHANQPRKELTSSEHQLQRHMKVLVLGDAQGNYQRTIEKASLLLAKQSFDCLICLGDLLPPSCSLASIHELLASEPFKIPCYFMRGPGGVHEAVLAAAQAEHGQVTTNLILLGESGVLSLSAGPLLGYHSESASEPSSAFSSAEYLEMLLLDALPPRDEASRTPHNETCIALVMQKLPKYAFACASQFEERTPYKADGRVVREIALASVANASKSKWFYAFNWTSESPRPDILASAIPSPYYSTGIANGNPQNPTEQGFPGRDIRPVTKRKRPPEGYCCKLCSEQDDHFYKDCPNKKQEQKKRATKQNVSIRPETCFFCLSNPSLARHLLVSIGDHGSYMALPKGAMTPNHVLIIPVSHVPTVNALKDSRDEVEGEMLRYVGALDTYYASLSSVAVIFELARSSGVHIHWQVIPVDPSKCDELLEAFHMQAEGELANA
jgi:hypothetical protein